MGKEGIIMMQPVSSDSLRTLYDTLLQLRVSVLNNGISVYNVWKQDIERGTFQFSALNLAFYLAIRCHDLRALQRQLLPLGLSSLGRSEARTMPNLDAVMASLGRICHVKDSELIPYPSRRRFFYGNRLLRRNAELIFGSQPADQYTKIMVTMPTEAAADYQIVHDLIASGMNVVRINCAHDDRDIWEGILRNVHRAERKLDRHCRVYMDLGGPKIRVSQVLVPGDESRVYGGDSLFLVRRKISAYPRKYTGNVVISCSIPQVFDHLKVGDPVLIDDGKLRCVVTEIVSQGAYLQVVTAREKGFNLKNKKSLNFPDTPLELSPLTKKDLKDLDFIMKNADAVGYSFVRNREDVNLLQQEMRKRDPEKARRIAIIAKIETRDSVHNLPEIIVQAASHNPFGVMIARGDLAVEAGYDRLAELQEEILWICEAAHVPVIWATQVLENLVKTGIPSRAEITDAAMSERAECVMLNKGPYIVKAVAALVDILHRMTRHQFKKSPQLEELHIALDTMEKYGTGQAKG
jgi:pyruvate kinase